MGDRIMDQSTFTLVVHPVHPVRILVNKIPIGGALLPVGVVNYLICVVVPEIKQFSAAMLKRHLTGLVSTGPTVLAWARWKVGPKLSPLNFYISGVENNPGRKKTTDAEVVTGFGDLRI